MSSRGSLHGGVITSDNHHMHGVIRLFTGHLQRRCTFTFYQHPNEIEIGVGHAFIVVSTLSDLAGVIRLYTVKVGSVPLIVHLAEPDFIDQIDYARLYPGAEIVPLAQANLATSAPDVTLRINLFREIIDRLAQV
jgi:hypothetical protein